MMTGIIILAAGASTRLGTPKQLLKYKRTTLLNHAIDVALAVGSGPVIVILGANAAAIRPTILSSQVEVVVCERWEEGMSASLKAGLAALIMHSPGIDAALFLLCDQPYVDETHLQALIDTRDITQKPLVASQYQGTLGAPMIIQAALFAEANLLTGPQGAKSLLSAHPEDVAFVAFPEGAIDIDTPEDYSRLMGSY